MNNKYNLILVPENKEHYLWVFLVLFSLLVFEFFLYPKIAVISLNKKLTGSFISQIKIYEGKSRQARESSDKEFKYLATEEFAFFKINGSVKDEFSNKFLENKGLNITKVNFSNTISSRGISEYPVYMELKCSMVQLKDFLQQLISFDNPIDITSVQIDSLSAQGLFAKIELVLKEVSKKNE